MRSRHACRAASNRRKDRHAVAVAEHRRTVTGGTGGAQHSLRAPLTGENFYFVMADRFENGRTDNDLGGLPAAKPISGFDPTDKGYYHGGDLAGPARSGIDYIQGLGTTAIWLTPSFKNKAVQPDDRSAGYHGYWITDFTQIDPHLGTNADLRGLVDDAHARGMKVFFDIITNHTADVIDYARGRAPGVRVQGRRPYRDASGTAVRRPRLRRHRPFPPLDPSVSFPYTPFVPGGRAAQGPRVAQRRDALPQPREHDVRRRELPVRRLLRARRPVHRAPARRARDDRHLQEVDRATSASTASASTP